MKTDTLSEGGKERGRSGRGRGGKKVYCIGGKWRERIRCFVRIGKRVICPITSNCTGLSYTFGWIWSILLIASSKRQKKTIMLMSSVCNLFKIMAAPSNASNTVKSNWACLFVRMTKQHATLSFLYSNYLSLKRVKKIRTFYVFFR